MINQPKIIASLAPMAGFTDYPMRKIAAELGAAYVVSEMISSVAMCQGDKKTAALAKIGDGEAPVVLQIFGHDPHSMREAARRLITGDFSGCSYAAAPAGIDINMGCPVRKIVTSGDGSALMCDPDAAYAVVSAVSEVCAQHGVPLSVKIRAGWTAESINCAEFALRMAQAGAEKITIHCRTRDQMYMPHADPRHAKSVAEALSKSCGRKVVLVGNGDIESRATAEEYLAAGCDEVAVGRAALGYPWIFSALNDRMFTPPTLDEIKSLAISLVEAVVREHGEECGVRESRSRAAYFIKGMRGAASVRAKLNRAETLAEFVKILESIGGDAE